MKNECPSLWWTRSWYTNIVTQLLNKWPCRCKAIGFWTNQQITGDSNQWFSDCQEKQILKWQETTLRHQPDRRHTRAYPIKCCQKDTQHRNKERRKEKKRKKERRGKNGWTKRKTSKRTREKKRNKHKIKRKRERVCVWERKKEREK